MTVEAPNRDAVLRMFKKAHRDWPTFISDSSPSAERAFFALADDERAQAVAHMSAYVQAVKRNKGTVCTFGVYLREKRWDKLPTGAGDAGKPDSALSGLIPAKPCGRAWNARRLAVLLSKPKADLTRVHVPLFKRNLMNERGPDGQLTARALTQVREHFERYAWPEVAEMHRRVPTAHVSLVPAVYEEISQHFVRVNVDSDLYDAWKEAHELRGWVQLPDTGPREYVWLPPLGNGQTLAECVSAGLDVFAQLVEPVVKGA